MIRQIDSPEEREAPAPTQPVEQECPRCGEIDCAEEREAKLEILEDEAGSEQGDGEDWPTEVFVFKGPEGRRRAALMVSDNAEALGCEVRRYIPAPTQQTYSAEEIRERLLDAETIERMWREDRDSGWKTTHHGHTYAEKRLSTIRAALAAAFPDQGEEADRE